MNINRRNFIQKTVDIALSGAVSGLLYGFSEDNSITKMINTQDKRGNQRLSLDKLKQFEDWGYGMFIHWGMPTYFDGTYGRSEYELTMEETIKAYNPDKLDVDQWISVARDAGMKYVVFTAKHGYSFELWPSKHSNHNVAFSSYKTDVVEKLVEACRKKGVKTGLYYPSTKNESLMTAQLTELYTQYGSIDEIWIDTPGVLTSAFRKFLYDYLAFLQPEAYIMMNRGMNVKLAERYDHFMPSDLYAIEKDMPSGEGYKKWHTIDGEEYYLPGEVCNPIGKNWFFLPDDPPRTDITEQYLACRQRGVNLLLNVPPDQHGLIRKEYIDALNKLRKNAGL